MLKPRYSLGAMAELIDALVMVAASGSFGLFTDKEDAECVAVVDALGSIDVKSCEDFRFTFVTDNEVDEDAVGCFCKGPMFPYRELIWKLAEDLIPEGAFYGKVEPVVLQKRSRPKHIVGGRLVYRKLEEYNQPSSVTPVPRRVEFQPSAAASKLRDAAVKSYEKMEKCLAQGVKEDVQGHLAGPSVSLHQRDDNLRVKAIHVGQMILFDVGRASPRFSQLFVDGVIVNDDGIVGAFNDMVLCGLEPQVVLSYGAEVSRFLHWMKATGLGFEDLSDLRVAGFIRNSAGRGKTVPGRVKSSLVWLQRLADLNFGADKVEVMRMVKSTRNSKESSDPEAAKMIPIEIVRKLEHGCKSASTGVLRLFCGLGCLLTFGVKRWSDAQRLSSLELGTDALVVKSWKSKKKKTSITWGALRSGFEMADWAVSFMKTLSEFGLPGEDYLLHAPRVDMMGFTRSPARWNDAERGIHAALIDVGVPVDEAISFTLHSFKHLLVTAGRQLQVPEPAIDVMAGWTVKSSSGMAAIYDSVSATSELLYKDYVHKNIQSGWTISETGSIPQAPLVSFNTAHSTAPLGCDVSPPKKAKLDQKGAGLQLQRMRDSPLNESIVQVLNQLTGGVHLFAHKSNWKNPSTVCGRWPCGSIKNPANGAEFGQTSETWTALNSFNSFCELCYGDAYPVDRCLPTPLRLKKGFQESESSASSESENSEIY